MDHTRLNLAEMLFILGLTEEEPEPGKFDTNLVLDEFHTIGAALAELMQQEALEVQLDGTVAVTRETGGVPAFGSLLALLREREFLHGRQLADLISKLTGPYYRERIFEPTHEALVRHRILRITKERRAKWLFLAWPKYHLQKPELRRALIDMVRAACISNTEVPWRVAYLVTFLRYANTRADILTEHEIESLAADRHARAAALQQGYSRDIAEAAERVKQRQQELDTRLLRVRPNNASFSLD